MLTFIQPSLGAAAMYRLPASYDADQAQWLEYLATVAEQGLAVVVDLPPTLDLLKLPWQPQVYQEMLAEYEAGFDADTRYGYRLGQLDRPEVVGRLGLGRARLLALLQLTLPGMPVIEAGDELGLVNLAWPTPPQHEIAYQDRRPDSMLQWYRQLLHLRATSAALSQGDFRPVPTSNSEVLAYVREAALTKCYVVLNFAAASQTVSLGQIGQWLAGTHQLHGDGQQHMMGAIDLEPYEGRLYEVRQGGSDEADL